MLASLTSKAIMTKAKAMYGKRVTAQQYQEMLHKKTVAELAEYLKNETAYAGVLGTVQSSTVHRGQLENLLHKAHYDQYLRLIHYDFGNNDSYYRYLMTDMEIEQILQMVRLLNAGAPENYITQYPEFLSRNFHFSMMELARVRDFDGLIRVLEGSPYGRLIMKCRPVKGGMIDYTACETILRTYFYQHVEDVIDKNFRGAVRRQLREIFDTHIELMNVVTIYRLKRYFPDSSRDYIKSCLMPRWNRIPDRILDPMIDAEDADSFFKELVRSPFSKYLSEDGAVFIEYSSERITYHLAKRYLRFASAAPTAFTAYMVLQNLELSNITRIIEGIRYEIPPADLEKLLVF